MTSHLLPRRHHPILNIHKSAQPLGPLPLELLRPIVRAYILGYASSTVPRLLTLLIAVVGQKVRNNGDEQRYKDVAAAVLRILRGGLDWRRFPTFCAALVGGSTILQIPLNSLITRLAGRLSATLRIRLARYLASFVAAWLSIRLLQSKESEGFIDRVPPNTYSANGIALKSRRFAGRTMDLTLFAVSRALDQVVGEIWAHRKARRTQWTRTDAAISYFTDPALFATSSALVMWCWIYVPEKLPRAYNKWISSAAQVDFRLIKALRLFRWGDLQYGRDTKMAGLIQGMCEQYGWPLHWGDPCQSIPFPCEIVHMGTGSSCEWHALSRFAKGFTLALGMYGSINLLLQLRNPSKKGFRRAIISSLRSSSFLGAFIALFYYGVCIARSRAGPLLIGKDAKGAQKIDSGICIGMGCTLCGWSILLENEGRRKDIALFVAPRALATILPRKYDMKYQWRETLAFAASTAIVFTYAKENPGRVRGVLGRVLESVLH